MKKLRHIVPKYQKMFLGFIGKNGDVSEGLVSRFVDQFGGVYGHASLDDPQKHKNALKNILAQKKYMHVNPNKPKLIKAQIVHVDDFKLDKNTKPDYVNRLHNKLTNHYTFNDDHKEALKQYTGGSSVPINKHIMGHSNRYDDSKIPGRIKEALVQHETPHDFAVHTGMTRSAIKQMYQAPGENKHGHFHIHLPAFTSTSLRRDIARDFSKEDEEENRHYVTIHVPKGSHGAYVSHVSEHPDEYEFILHPGAKIHIAKQPRIITSSRIVNWVGHLVHDGIKHLTSRRKG